VGVREGIPKLQAMAGLGLFKQKSARALATRGLLRSAFFLGAWSIMVYMAGLGLFDQKSAIAVTAVTMPIVTAFKFCIGHRKNGLLNR
jgi:hypothetical protein